MKTFIFVVIAIICLKIGIASADPVLLKKGDRAMVRVSETQDVLVKIIYFYDDGSARICSEAQGPDDFLGPHCNFATLPVADLIHPVSSIGGFKLADNVCLNKKIGSFNKGSCGRVTRIYENGKIELLTFSLFGLRKKLNTYDVLVDLQDIHHKH